MQMGIPVCKWGSPYANIYTWGSGDLNPHMHTATVCNWLVTGTGIPPSTHRQVCLHLGSELILKCIQGFRHCFDTYMHTGFTSIPIYIQGLVMCSFDDPNMHTGIPICIQGDVIRLIPICIWGSLSVCIG
jgi:hypothetical protein